MPLFHTDTKPHALCPLKLQLWPLRCSVAADRSLAFGLRVSKLQLWGGMRVLLIYFPCPWFPSMPWDLNQLWCWVEPAVHTADPDNRVNSFSEGGHSSQRNYELRGVMVQTDVASLIHSPHFLSGILRGCFARMQLIQARRSLVDVWGFLWAANSFLL